MELREMQNKTDQWVSRFEEGYWPPLAQMAKLTEEVGELAREINHKYGNKPKKTSEPESSIALELGDILFVVSCLANAMEIDLEKAFLDILEKYQVRDADRWTPKSTIPPRALKTKRNVKPVP